MSMFCFQCEQTAKGTGCTIQGVCGKLPQTAGYQDNITGMLVTLALALEGKPAQEEDAYLHTLALEGLFMTITNVNFSDKVINAQVDKTAVAVTKLTGNVLPI